MDFKKIEQKWQKAWEAKKIFQAKESNKKKFYMLEMYSYPSATGLHMGHTRNYTIGDIQARFKRMNNFNVLYPTGFDSFGLPAENAAIENKQHPKIYTEKAIKNFTKQLKQLGLSYDWDRKVESHNPNYYKWDQWIFLQLLKKGLAYKKKAIVNWCPKCNTVLANEQVKDGKCWRHTETDVQLKQLSQWFFKITKYADKLNKDLGILKDWPEDIKLMQKNWIGKSKGTLIDFQIENTKQKLSVFTTRTDTLYGVTFMTFAPENPKVLELVYKTKYEKDVKKFIKEVQKQDKFERTDPNSEKKGLFIGKYAIHPLTKKKIPIYIANFVLAEYGTGAVMAVPGHDQRDFDFAKKYKIPIKKVIESKQGKLKEPLESAYVNEGVLVNSSKFNGMESKRATEAITIYLEKIKKGKATTQYRLRDWLISRQRYWGCPIPIIYCKKCGEVPVPEKSLPVKLPNNVEFKGKGNPLETVKSFVNTKCPKCKGNATRETDTMDTFIDSSWYFLRFCDANNHKKIFDTKKANYWLPIDLYIGGREHATGHLIYFRFITKFFKDLKLLKFKEPATRLFNQGFVNKGGQKMSKSLGNVVEPIGVFSKYGVDATRFYMVFVASPDKNLEWSDKGIQGALRSVNKIYSLANKRIVSKESPMLTNKKNIAISKVTKNISEIKYNLALIDLMEYVNYLSSLDSVSKSSLETLCILVSPFCPHLAEEMWTKLKNKAFVSLAKWPKPGSIDKALEEDEQLIHGFKVDLNNILKLIDREVKTCTVYTIPKEKIVFSNYKEQLEKEFGLKFNIYAVNDKDVKDPENKRKKAKPNKPAIFLE